MKQTNTGKSRVLHYLKVGLFLLLFVVPISLASWVVLDLIKTQMKGSIQENLESVLRTTGTAIHSWLDDTIDRVRLETEGERVRDLIDRLVKVQAAGGDMAEDPAQYALRDYLKPWLEKNEMTGYFVFTPSGVNIASTWEQNIGILTPIINQGESYSRAITGDPQLVLPYRSEVAVPNINGELRVGEPTMSILVPVHDPSGQLTAVFGVRFDPAQKFSRIAHLPRSGKTGDSYFFNQYGKIITEGRFDDDLRKHGIIPPDNRSILTLRIANPGGNMIAGYIPDISREEMPLTFMARSAISGNEGSNVEGYRDYRGIWVVGAWTWDDKYGFGMTYEIDVSEAFRYYFMIRRIVIIGFFVMLSPFLLLLYISAMRERDARRSSDRLIQNEKKLRDVTDTVQDAIVMIGPDDRIKFWSMSAEKMFGFSREEAVDKKLHQLIVPEHYRKEAYAGLDRFYVSGQGPIVGSLREVAAIRKDGTQFQGELSINRISMDEKWWAVGTVRDISERKQVEKALLLSEARLMEAQEIANLGHWELDIATQKLKLSSETYRIYGLDSRTQTLSSSYFRSVVHPDDWEAVNQAYADSLATGKEYNIDYRIVLQDGVIKYINERCKTEYDREGNPRRSLGTILDITILKENEIELFRLSERFKLASRAAGIGVWDLDLQSGVIIWDDSMYELYEVDKAEFSGRESSWHSLVHADDLASMQEKTQQAIQGMGPLDTIFRICTPEGNIKHIKVDAQVYRDDHDRPVRMIGINYDITRRVKTEAELKALNEELEERVKERTADLEKARIAALSIMQDANLQRERAENALAELEQSQKKLAVSEGRFRGLVESTDDIIWEKNREGLYTYISPTVKDILGFTQEEMMGRTAVSFIAEEYAGAWKNVMQQAMDADKPIGGFEYAHLHKTKPRPVFLEANISLMYNHDHTVTGFRGVSRDITERKQSERELTLALERAESATLAKSEFLANMSHEIRTPMNAIIGMAYLALQTELTGKQADYLTKIQSSAQSLLGIINDILDFSKIEAGKLSLEVVAFNLSEILDHVADLAAVKGLEKKDLKVVVDTDAQTPLHLIGDPLRLTQVLTNLVNNAIKFTEKGQVVISTRQIEKKGEKAILEFSVRDTGIGLDEKQVDQLFKAFSQVDASMTRKYGGTGLGLTISKNLVGMMGGDISVRSRLGEGSTFTFTALFDIARERVYEDTSPQPRPLPGSGIRGRVAESLQGARVLLVEDNEINQQVAVEILEGAGLVASVAGNGKDALRALQTAEYDAVLMDIQMPVMDGYQASLEIRRNPRFRDLPIIAMTAHAMTGDREKSLQAGMNDHVTKPIDRNQLFASLLKWVKPTERAPSRPPLAPPEENRRPDDDFGALENVPGIDVAAGLERVTGNQALYGKLLKRFQKEHADSAAQVKAFLEARDDEKAGQLVHTIKGLAGNLGAVGLQEQAEKLETAMKEADVSRLDALMEPFESALRMVITSIQKLAPGEVEEQDKTALKGEQDSPWLLDLLNALEPNLRTGKLTPSRKIIKEIAELPWPPDLKNDLKDLQNAVQKFDYEQAESILKRMKTQLKTLTPS